MLGVGGCEGTTRSAGCGPGSVRSARVELCRDTGGRSAVPRVRAEGRGSGPSGSSASEAGDPSLAFMGRGAWRGGPQPQDPQERDLAPHPPGPDLRAWARQVHWGSWLLCLADSEVSRGAGG